MNSKEEKDFYEGVIYRANKKLHELEKELRQTKSNFKNSQTHSKNCYKKLKEKYLKLEKENKELKETLNKTRKMGLEIIEEKEQLSNELHKLNCYRNIELNEITKLKKAIEILKNKTIVILALELSKDLNEYNKMTSFEKLTQEEFELLKEVFKYE